MLFFSYIIEFHQVKKLLPAGPKNQSIKVVSKSSKQNQKGNIGENPKGKKQENEEDHETEICKFQTSIDEIRVIKKT